MSETAAIAPYELAHPEVAAGAQRRYVAARQLLEGLVNLVESSTAEICRADWGRRAYVVWQDAASHRRALICPHQRWLTLVLISSDLHPEEVA